MGIDFQLIAYTGVPLTDDSLARAILRHVRVVTLYRHAKAPFPARKDLHLLALYEGPDDRTETVEISKPALGQLPKDASLADRVQAAWKMTLQQIKANPVAVDDDDDDDDDDTELTRVAILGRELSRIVGKVFWVSQGDHSCVGGYAAFENGELVDPASEEDVYADGEDYIEVPEKKWLAATVMGVTPSDAFLTAFPDTDDPPLRLAFDLDKRMTFDPAEFEVSLE